jgi:hypothetical protein
MKQGGQLVLFFLLCVRACIDIRILTALLGHSLPPHYVKEVELFLPFPVFDES